MNLVSVKNVVTSRAGRQLLVVQKNSPTILFVGGVVGIVGAGVLACRATLKLEGVIQEAEEAHDFARSLAKKKDRTRDHAYINAKTAIKVTKLYAPAVGLGVVSVGALTGSHLTLTRRNVAVTAAYAAVEKSFNEYRQRVIDDEGEDKDREYRYGSETREIIEETKTGPQPKTIKSVARQDPSGYARFFDETCPSWEPNSEYNLYFLRCQQDYFTRKLHARGHVFLNEVYDTLGIERSKAGAVVGWILSKDGSTDNYIDFGLYESNERARAFINGRENSVLLDFNVDGLIYDLIEKKRSQDGR